MQRLKVAVVEGKRSALIAAATSLALFIVFSRFGVDNNSLVLRQALVAAGIFVLLFVALRLFSSVVRAHRLRLAACYDIPLEEQGRGMRLFVIYKEVVKAVMGCSFTLAWLAGLLFIVEKFASQAIFVPFGLTVLYSAALFAVSYLFVLFVDNIPYPGNL